jgi:hypothetical protein
MCISSLCALVVSVQIVDNDGLALTTTVVVRRAFPVLCREKVGSPSSLDAP